MLESFKYVIRYSKLKDSKINVKQSKFQIGSSDILLWDCYPKDFTIYKNCTETT